MRFSDGAGILGRYVAYIDVLVQSRVAALAVSAEREECVTVPLGTVLVWVVPRAEDFPGVLNTNTVSEPGLELT